MKIKIHIMTAMYFIHTTKDMIVSQIPNEIHNYRIICNNLNSYTIVQLENTQSKNKKEDYNNSNKELINFLDCVDFPEPSIEELNNCIPVTLDYDSLDELLKDKQGFKSLTVDNKSNSDSNENFIENREECMNNELSKYINIINREHSNLPSEIKEEESMWDTLKINIEHKVSIYVPNSYCDKYLGKLKAVEEACIIFDNHKFHHFTFDSSKDVKFVKELRELFSKFEMRSKFSKETFEKFFKKFDLKIFYGFYSKEFRSKLIRLSGKQKNILFYSEFIKLYKYLGEVPELLVLGSSYSTFYDNSIIFIIHLINIFVENIKNDRFFILCMISKALTCFYRGNIDIFLIPNFELECGTSNHNLYYFLWELNKIKRYEINNRKKNQFRMVPNDNNYLMIVFLTYLYQLKILDKYHKIEPESIKLLKNFIDKINESKDCLGCLLDEYCLNVLPKIIKNCKF